MVDPSNEPKTDKLSILGEAIRYVQQTQLENSQLRQLNKFLEVKRGCWRQSEGMAVAVSPPWLIVCGILSQAAAEAAIRSASCCTA